MRSTPQYNEYEIILNNDYLTKEQKIFALELLKQNAEKQFNQQLMYKLLLKRLGAGLEIGSAAIPLGGVGRAGASIGGNLLKKI